MEENKKSIIKNVVIVILLLAIVGIFTVPQYLDKQYQEAYQTGFNESYLIGVNDGVIYLATLQTQSANMTFVVNNELRSLPLATLCQGVQG